jgi:hypothetical protein
MPDVLASAVTLAFNFSMNQLAWLDAIIFFVLSLLHVYWLFGGKGGINSVVPTKGNTNDKIFTPSAISTLVVAVGLLLFGLIEIGNTNVFSDLLELKYFQWAIC